MNGISLIIPVFNTDKKYIEECIKSIINYKHNNLEIVIINDFSTNECKLFLEEISKIDDRIRLINLPQNKGVSNARNIGIESAKYDWISFIDSDDWIENNALDKIFELIKMKNMDVLIFNSNVVEGKRKNKNKFLVNNDGYINDFTDIKLQIINKSSSTYSPRYNCVGVTWGKIYRKKILQDNDLKFNTSLERAEDHIFFLNLLKYNPRIYYINDYLYNYRKNEKSVVNKYNKNVKITFKNTLYELKKIVELEANEEFFRAYNMRCISYLLTTLSNDYFHKDNKTSWDAVYDELNMIQKMEPFYSALNIMNIKEFNKKDQLKIILLKNEKYKLLKNIYKFKRKRY